MGEDGVERVSLWREVAAGTGIGADIGLEVQDFV